MIVIGEKVNATRKGVRRAVEERDEAYLRNLIVRQDEAGAQYIDLNAGTGSGASGQETADLLWLVDLALDATEKKLCLDSADPEALIRAAGHVAGRRPWMLNSVKGDAAARESLLPLLAEHGQPFVALAMDEQGIANDIGGRLRVVEALYEDIHRRGMDPSLAFVDPLVLPLVTDVAQARVTCECIRQIKERFPECKTVVGLTNISHGLPARGLVNRGFLTACAMSGLDAAILDPTDWELNRTRLAAEALAGADPHCRRLTRAWRRGALGPKPERKKP